MGVTSQFLLLNNMRKKAGTMGVISNLLRQVNAKCGRDLYRMALPKSLTYIPTMIVGIDLVNMGRKCVLGMTATYNRHMMQHISGTAVLELYKDQLNKGMTMKQQQE